MKIAIVVKILDHERLQCILLLEKQIKEGRPSPPPITVFYSSALTAAIPDAKTFSTVRIATDFRFLGPEDKALSHAVLEALKNTHFDHAIFIDAPELAHYSVMCKRIGRGLHNTKLTAINDNADFRFEALGIAEHLTQLTRVEMANTCQHADLTLDKSTLGQEEFASNLIRETPVPSVKQEPHSTDGTKPLVSVCIVHHNRHEYLPGLLECFESQTYDNFEIILVDDGSDRADSIAYLKAQQKKFDEKNWQIIKQDNKYLGAARNTAASAARGKYLVFSDDDNYPQDNELEAFVSAMELSGADIVTCGANLFFGSEITSRPKFQEFYAVPYGDLPQSAFFENVFGDANCCVRVSTYKTLGGFTEDYGIGYEDWEFFLKASMHGYKILVIPEILFWYRIHPSSMVNVTDATKNRQRVLRNIFDVNDYPAVLQMANNEFIKLNTRSTPLNLPLLGGLLQFIQSPYKSHLIKRFLYSARHFGIRQALKRLNYYGKSNL